MPANGYNEGFSHPNVIRYDGSNLEEVRQRMQERFGGSYSLEELVNKITPENKPDLDEVSFGEPVGKEVW